jgi:hypothetical protein
MSPRLNKSFARALWLPSVWSLCIVLVLLTANDSHAQSSTMKSAWLERVGNYSSSHPDFGVVTARLVLGRDTALAYRELDTLLTRHYGDMFWAMWTSATYYATQDVLRPDYKRRIREAWKIDTPYRGDTENHFLLYYTAWFLMSQAFPDDPASTWFNGKSAQENYAEAREYLESWVRETSRHGQTEWDSPRYGYYYITPLILLSEYTKDARLKKLFEQALDLQLADYAIDYLDGNYCGAHSRVSDAGALNAKDNEINVYGSYFFGDSVENVREDVAFAALSHFECPKIIRDIALDRSSAFESYEYKRGRTTIRDSHELNAPVYKYTYMTKDYALGSMQGGIVQPIQQQSWSLVLPSNSAPNVVTGLHPYYDSSELAMFFPEYPQFMMERIGNVKHGYPSEDKWVGGSPYERIYQEKNVLVWLCDLPDSVKYHHADLFIPWQAYALDSNIKIDTVDYPAEWNITTTNNTHVGIFPLAPNERSREAGGVRLRMKGSHSGAIVICESSDKISSTEFARKLLDLKITQQGTRIYSAGDRGKTIDISRTTVTRPLIANVERENWLYHSPYVNSKRGSGIVTLTHGRDKLLLDFRR